MIDKIIDDDWSLETDIAKMKANYPLSYLDFRSDAFQVWFSQQDEDLQQSLDSPRYEAASALLDKFYLDTRLKH